MQLHILRTTFALVAVLALVLGLGLVGSRDAGAQGNGATVVRTPGDTCGVETSPGVFEEFTCDNLDVFTPNGKIRSHASGVTAPPADGNADVTADPVCPSMVSASGRVRLNCHLDF